MDCHTAWQSADHRIVICDDPDKMCIRDSSKEEHVIYGLPEGSYTLHEELAPYEDGYVSALSLIHI